jgi:leucyl-tRNA synthetase
LGEGGEKMSKSRGNVVNPNDIVAQYGADTMRLYIMFVGDFEQAAIWSTEAVKGSKRFLDRVWNLAENASESYDVTPANEPILHKTIKKVTDDIDNLKMNTAIAAMMTAVNELSANGVTRGDLRTLILLLNPFAPHITEELWENLGFAAQTGKMCCQAEWPVYDESKTVASTVDMAVQVNGKLKGSITMPADSEEQAVVDAALAVEKVQKATEGMKIVKTIHVKNRLVNLIVKPQ